MAKVTMPQLGESVAEGTIGKWLKQPGDHVDKYEPLLEVITDKVNAEVPSPFEGVLKEILAEEGATVPNNAEIAVIETADDGASSDGAQPAEAKAEPATEQDAAKDTAKPAVDDPAPVDTTGPAGSDESANGSSAGGAAAAPATSGTAPTASAARGRTPGSVPPRPPHRRPRAMPTRG